MNCALCKTGHTEPGKVTVSLTRGESVVVIREVPADVCVTCGEYFLSSDVAKKVLSRAEAAVSMGVEVEVIRYVA